MKQTHTSDTAFTTHATGFPSLDALINGGRGPFGPGLIVITGRSGDGKSCLALNLLLNAARRGTPCKYYSMHATTAQLTVRLDAGEEARDIGSLPIRISGRPERDVENLRMSLNRTAARDGTKIAVLDDFQMLATSPGMWREGRETQTAHMSRLLRVAALESGMLLYVISQLDAEARLREARGLENASDAIVYITGDEERHLWVSKNHAGPIHGRREEITLNGGIPLKLDGPRYRLSES